MRDYAIDGMARDVLADLSEKLGMFVLMEGEYADIPEGDEHAQARDEYGSALDDAVERSLDKYVPALSANWLGTNTIDTQAWGEDEWAKLAQSAAKEMFKELTHGKTPAQSLASAGIVADHLDGLMSRLRNGEKPAMNAPDESAIADIAARVGALGLTIMEVYEDVEMIVGDDDELLIAASRDRLKLTAEDVNALQMHNVMEGDTPDAIVQHMQGEVQSSAAPVATASAAPVAEAEANDADNVPSDTFAILKDCGLGATDGANLLNVSRSTYAKYERGTAGVAYGTPEAGVIRAQIVERANKLLAALAAFDRIPTAHQVE